MFVSIKGGSWVTFERAVAGGHAAAALAASYELPRPLQLSHALALTCVLRSHPAFEAAALRWHSRFVQEVKGLSVSDASLALAAFAAMPSSFEAAAGALTGLFEACGRPDLAEVLDLALARQG